MAKPGFQKNNQLWKKGLKTRNEKKEKIDEFLIMLANNGIDEYGGLMSKLLTGECKLTKAEIEFMDRFEGWREYIRPKLARSELTGKDGKELPQPIINVIHQDDSYRKDNEPQKEDKGNTGGNVSVKDGQYNNLLDSVGSK